MICLWSYHYLHHVILCKIGFLLEPNFTNWLFIGLLPFIIGCSKYYVKSKIEKNVECGGTRLKFDQNWLKLSKFEQIGYQLHYVYDKLECSFLGLIFELSVKLYYFFLWNVFLLQKNFLGWMFRVKDDNVGYMIIFYVIIFQLYWYIFFSANPTLKWTFFSDDFCFLRSLLVVTLLVLLSLIWSFLYSLDTNDWDSSLYCSIALNCYSSVVSCLSIYCNNLFSGWE